jgi:rubrerythrin
LIEIGYENRTAASGGGLTAPSAVIDESPETDGGRSRLALIVAAGAGAAAATPLLRPLFRAADAAAASKAQDARILQLVLQLEYTQVAFYETALREASLTGALRDFAQAALAHERDHLAVVKQALGGKAGKRPRFEFRSSTKSPRAFREAAIKLEDIAVSGYNGQATNLTKPTLAAAAKIVSVEARHAAWVRAIAGQVAAPDPVDKPLTANQVVAGLREIGWRAS